MKKICVVTGTRAEYGLLKPVILKLKLLPEVDLKLVVTGMHLSTEFGLTYKFIEEDSITIDKKIEILLSSDSPSAVSKSMAIALMEFSTYFKETSPDLLLLLGDRFEIFAVATAATLFNIPIAHIHGGESTEGAYDEAFRHSISKMSYIHFTSTEIYRKRVIQLGENPSRVFNVGSLGVENINTLPLLTLNEVEKLLDMDLSDNFALVTFHPTTHSSITETNIEINQLISALTKCSKMKFIISKCNSDNNGHLINSILEDFCFNNPTIAKLFSSLGQIPYLSAMKYCSMVIGNSSSGILEAPAFRVPTINIGNRQAGRLQASSVINTLCNSNDILNAINIALSPEFRQSLSLIHNPYYSLRTSDKIVEIIMDIVLSPININKKFYDLP